MERQAQPYRFRAWCVDIRLWSTLTDLAPDQQAAAIILRLEGAAHESARCLSQQEIANGGIVRGRRLDPVSYILAG